MEESMSYITKNKRGKTCFTDSAKNDFKIAPIDCKDGVLMDMLGEMTFGCGKTRWDSPILFTHLDSRRIVVAIQCPTDACGWNRCPYITPNPGETFAFVHEQAYEVRVMGEVNGFKTILYEEDFPSNMLGAMHWFELPKNIRKVWESSR
jgi:hypothetical protein